jgi:hypothetical protein
MGFDAALPAATLFKPECPPVHVSFRCLPFGHICAPADTNRIFQRASADLYTLVPQYQTHGIILLHTKTRCGGLSGNSSAPYCEIYPCTTFVLNRGLKHHHSRREPKAARALAQPPFAPQRLQSFINNISKSFPLSLFASSSHSRAVHGSHVSTEHPFSCPKLHFAYLLLIFSPIGLAADFGFWHTPHTSETTRAISSNRPP